MVALLSLGPAASALLGTRGYLMTYIVSGLGGSLMSLWRCPHRSVGASGALFGLTGALFVTYKSNEGALGRSATQHMTMQLGRSIAANLCMGITSEGIDNWCACQLSCS
jgi:rhomboid protease GluP